MSQQVSTFGRPSLPARRSGSRLVRYVAAAVSLSLLTSAVALAAAPRRNASYAAAGAHSTVVSLHTSAHGRITTYNFQGKCPGHGSWFFNSVGERAIPVSSSGAFALRRTEHSASPKTGQSPPPGTFTFTLSGRFGSGGSTVSGRLSFVLNSSLGVACKTGSIAFHGSLK